jgi:hypothetical protein
MRSSLSYHTKTISHAESPNWGTLVRYHQRPLNTVGFVFDSITAKYKLTLIDDRRTTTRWSVSNLNASSSVDNQWRTNCPLTFGVRHNEAGYFSSLLRHVPPRSATRAASDWPLKRAGTSLTTSLAVLRSLRTQPFHDTQPLQTKNNGEEIVHTTHRPTDRDCWGQGPSLA